ncbi:unnamed protein product, partial [Protopolystoma xenopodis]
MTRAALKGGLGGQSDEWSRLGEQPHRRVKASNLNGLASGEQMKASDRNKSAPWQLVCGQSWRFCCRAARLDDAERSRPSTRRSLTTQCFRRLLLGRIWASEQETPVDWRAGDLRPCLLTQTWPVCTLNAGGVYARGSLARPTTISTSARQVQALDRCSAPAASVRLGVCCRSSVVSCWPELTARRRDVKTGRDCMSQSNAGMGQTRSGQGPTSVIHAMTSIGAVYSPSPIVWPTLLSVRA